MTQRPNILMIVTDQHRADTIGALGNKLIRTPAMDSLVEAGTSFPRAYTPAPICSPARVAMATGIPPHQHRFTDHDWWHWEDENTRLDSPHDPAFMQCLQEGGYQTFMTGKLHFHGRSWLTDGVEEFAGSEPQLSPRCRTLEGHREFLRRQGYPPCVDVMGWGQEYYMVPQITLMPPEHTNPHWVADQAVDFLSRRDADRPFLCCVHFPGPHPPVRNPMPWAKMYRGREMDAPHRPENYTEYQCRTNRYQNRYKGKDTAQEDDTGYRFWKSAYYGNISQIDWNIGRILEALGDQRDNTLILLTADHGELAGDYGCVGKRCMLEPSIRIPMVAAWGGHIPAGKTCRTPVSLMDVFPTVMDVLGREQPGDSEGRSLLATASAEDQQRIVFSQFSSGWCGQYGASDGQWKYAYSAPDNKEWLFEIGDSLAEGPNRIDDPAAAEAKDRLKSALLARHAPSADPWSDAVADGDWKIHTPPPEDYLDDPTYGYLDQEKQHILDGYYEAMKPMGDYARPEMRQAPQGNLHGDHGVMGGRCPFENIAD